MLLQPPGVARANSGANCLSPRARVVFIGCTLVIAMVAAYFGRRAPVTAPADVATFPSRPVFESAPDHIPAFSESWVTPPGHTPLAHSSAICALPSGDLLAVWYGGSREGAPDVSLFTSRLPADGGKWTEPKTAMDRAMAEDELDRSTGMRALSE